MQTSVDAERRPRSLARWFAALALLAALGVAVLLRMVTADDAPVADDGLSAQLAGQVVAILEASTPDEHADHGHHFGDEGAILCVAETIGFDPPTATEVAQVRTVYAEHMCAVVAGIPWPQAVRASGPIAVELTNPPEVVLPLPREGVTAAEAVREVIPPQYQERALSAEVFSDPSVSGELKDRIEAALG